MLIFHGTTLIEATKISIDLLAKAKTRFLAQLDQELKDQLLKDHPHLFQKPA